MKRKTLPALLVLAAVAAIPGRPDGLAYPLHFALSKSSPEADSNVQAPEEVKLWFTQVPQDGTTSIRVLNADGEPVPTSEIVQDEEDGTAFSVALEDAPASGHYTVAWRALGEDGHVVRGEFSFTVMAR
jgi:methionine-rich copper-binding protein CopC